ncbi:MAG: pitrilysin family protein [Pyrinomonadaceae bacterium]
MKKHFFIFWLALSLSGSTALAQHAKPQIKKPVAAAVTTKPAAITSSSSLLSSQPTEVPIVTKTLANGLDVIVFKDSSVPVATVELAVRNGSFTEPPELNGLSHLFEHMMFQTNDAVKRFRQGIPLASDKYLSQIGDLGIPQPNGRTQEEVVYYYYTAISQDMPIIMQSLRDAVRFPTFDEKEFAGEKLNVIAELDRQEASPFYYLDRELKDKLFYKYPTRKNPGGTRETVNSATTAQMRLIQARYYVPNNSALVVTGDVVPEDVFKKAEELFGDWQKTDDPFKRFPLVEHPPLTASVGEVIQKPEVENVFISIGWQGPSIGKDDASTYAADVFSYILQQPNSRFQRNLVDSRLTSGVSVSYYTQRNVGPIQITAVTTPDKAQAAVKAIYTEIAAFNNPNYFTDEELESSKALLAASELYDREKPSEYIHTLSFWWSTASVDYFRGYQKNLRATTRADISRYVSTYIQAKPHVGLALLSPDAQTAAKLTEKDLIGK